MDRLLDACGGRAGAAQRRQLAVFSMPNAEAIPDFAVNSGRSLQKRVDRVEDGRDPLLQLVPYRIRLGRRSSRLHDRGNVLDAQNVGCSRAAEVVRAEYDGPEEQIARAVRGNGVRFAAVEKGDVPLVRQNAEGRTESSPCRASRGKAPFRCASGSQTEEPSLRPDAVLDDRQRAVAVPADSFIFLNSLVLIGNTTFPSAVCQNRYKI